MAETGQAELPQWRWRALADKVACRAPAERLQVRECGNELVEQEGASQWSWRTWWSWRHLECEPDLSDSVCICHPVPRADEAACAWRLAAARMRQVWLGASQCHYAQGERFNGTHCQ